MYNQTNKKNFSGRNQFALHPTQSSIEPVSAGYAPKYTKTEILNQKPKFTVRCRLSRTLALYGFVSVAPLRDHTDTEPILLQNKLNVYDSHRPIATKTDNWNVYRYFSENSIVFAVFFYIRVFFSCSRAMPRVRR